MAHDFIEHSKRIEAALRESGHGAEADLLEDARLAASTSGELLMRLRHESRNIKAQQTLPQNVRIDLIALIKAIDASGL